MQGRHGLGIRVFVPESDVALTVVFGQICRQGDDTFLSQGDFVITNGLTFGEMW